MSENLVQMDKLEEVKVESVEDKPTVESVEDKPTVESVEDKLKIIENVINEVRAKVDVVSDQYNELEINIYKLLKGMLDEVETKTQ